jgi:hypothetical protein
MTIEKNLVPRSVIEQFRGGDYGVKDTGIIRSGSLKLATYGA